MADTNQNPEPLPPLHELAKEVAQGLDLQAFMAIFDHENFAPSPMIDDHFWRTLPTPDDPYSTGMA